MTAVAPQTLATVAERLRARLVDDILPWWAIHGVDTTAGGFFERIDADDRPTDEPRRTRLVARQIYVFAQARRFGWLAPAVADALVDHGLAFLAHRCLAEDGTVRVAVAPDGTVIRDGIELYDHAFALFALAEVARLRPADDAPRALAARIRDALVAGWKHPLAGFERARPRRLPLEANPHMHLFEAVLAWTEVAPADPAWRARLADLATLAFDRLIDAETGAIREWWDGDWRPWPHADAAPIEPGHQFEWAWLLARWSAATGRPEGLAAARRLVALAEAHGIAPDLDLAIAGLDDRFAPSDRLLRLWPQTERLKAHLRLAAAATPEAAAAHDALAARAGAGVLRLLDNPRRHLWFDALAPDATPLAEPTRASSLYHVVLAFTELAARHAP